MNKLLSLCFLFMHMLEIMSYEEGQGAVQIIMKGLLLVDISLSQKSFDLLSQATDLDLGNMNEYNFLLNQPHDKVYLMLVMFLVPIRRKSRNSFSQARNDILVLDLAMVEERIKQSLQLLPVQRSF